MIAKIATIILAIASSANPLTTTAKPEVRDKILEYL